jgi:hypothetical protein
MKMRFFLLFSFFLISSADSSVDTDGVSDAILGLHTQQGPGKSYIVWSECGRNLRGKKAQDRAEEYAGYIASSILDVRRRYTEDINPDHVVAILYRESSNNECAIGRKEIGEIFGRSGEKATKVAIERKLREWSSANKYAYRACRKRGKSVDLDCLDRNMSKINSNFRGIYGWDLGASQFRWPGSQTRSRKVVMPDGESVGVSLKTLMHAEVSIQMLVEDLALYKKKCRSHRHYIRKRGRRVLLDTEDAYFVHHHTGERAWSERYWKRVNKHLVSIDSNRSKKLLAKISSQHIL